MKRNMTMQDYCKESGFPINAMKQLVHSYLGERFAFRTTTGKTAPYYIIVPVFESMQEAGEFKEVLEG